MNQESKVPDRFPVRQVAGRWEVLIAQEDLWVPCDSEDDARTIALAPVLEYESLERDRSGVSFAEELERTADILEKYGIRFGSRFFRRRGQEVRDASV